MNSYFVFLYLHYISTFSRHNQNCKQFFIVIIIKTNFKVWICIFLWKNQYKRIIYFILLQKYFFLSYSVRYLWCRLVFVYQKGGVSEGVFWDLDWNDCKRRYFSKLFSTRLEAWDVSLYVVIVVVVVVVWCMCVCVE